MRVGDPACLRPGPQGFTLVEVLIVVAILGILAALVVPRFSSADDTARENALRENLRALRTQIMVYRAQHGGVAPGYPDGDAARPPSGDAFVAQMTRYTSATGQVSPVSTAVCKYGPYLSAMPTNPINHSAAIRFVPVGEPFPNAPVGTEGWVYQPSTGAMAANVTGRDGRGVAYFDY